MTITTHRYDRVRTPYPLGRHVRHDARSTAYGVPVRPRSAIRSVTWERRIPILNQGQIGSCVANTGVEHLATDSLRYTGVTSITIKRADAHGKFTPGTTWALDELLAQQLYRLLTLLDSYSGSWEPDDTGSDGITLAKALKTLGLADSYRHAFGYPALVSALQTGPVCIGTVWFNSMFEPKPDGELVVDTASGEAGGHEYLARQFDADNDRVWIDNHWGQEWGVDGRAWISGDGMRTLLAAQGDVTVPHLIGEAPGPTPAVSDTSLWGCIKQWAAGKGLS